MGTLLIKRLFCSGKQMLHAARTKCTVGDKVAVTKRITVDDVRRFAHLSGDTNPIHLPTNGQMAVVHGALLNGLVSGVIGTKLPGAGTLVAWQSLHFPHKCYAGESVHVSVEVTEVRKIIKLKFAVEVEANSTSDSGREGKCVLHGEAKVVQR